MAGASRPARLHRAGKAPHARPDAGRHRGGFVGQRSVAHNSCCDAVVLSDDAGQFNVGRHALCWVHAERLVHKLDTFTDQQRARRQRVRGLIWDFYASLKAYRLNPDQRRSVALRARFDRIFLRRTGFATLDRLLARLHANKAELLMVLDRPEIPLHTNGSENDIRCYVTRRKVSAGTRSRDRPRLPRRVPEPRQDLRQTRHRGLGLSGQQAPGGGTRHIDVRSIITSGLEPGPPDPQLCLHFCPCYLCTG